MTAQEYHSYRFSSGLEPSDEQLARLMENVAEKVRQSNREADERFFAELRRACDEAKSRNVSVQNAPNK